MLIDPNTGQPIAEQKAGGFPPRIDIPHDAKVSHIGTPAGHDPVDGYSLYDKWQQDVCRRIQCRTDYRP